MYLPERDVLIPLLNSEYYKTYFEYLDLNYIKENHRELHYVYLALKSLHEEFPDTDHSLKSLQAYFFTKYPDCDKEIYTALFENLAEVELDPEIGSSILKQIKRRQQALKLSESAIQFATGYSSLEKVKDSAKFLEEELEEDTESIEVVSDDLELLLNDTVTQPGLRWRLQCLNKSMGSLRKGDFGFLFARPETGKTTFLASEVSHMLTQLKDDDGPIVWFNMEEQGNKVMLRVYQAYFGITLEQLLANPKRYKDEWDQVVRGKLKLVDNANLTKQEVERIVEKLKPSLMVQDQTPKVKGFAADRDDLRLGSIFQWSRELAKKYCPVIGVSQADGNAENTKWLTMDHVANVKTAAQAEADWILGIGKVNSEGAEFTRYLNLSKNKLAGDSDSLPDLRHLRTEVYIEPRIARYVDIINYD